MRVLAPAKINLHLRVGRRRADGFHPLLSWMVTVGLFDTLDFTREEKGAGTGARPDTARFGELTLTSDSPALPCDRNNLIVKAADALRQVVANGASAGGARIALAKRIPLGAGLGGGSSDGARTLLALNALWNVGWSMDRLQELAAGLGSDLPFFFHPPSAICMGRGEIVHAVPSPTPRWVVLVLPDFPMPTAEVYRTFDELGLGNDEAVRNQPNCSHWATLAADRLLPLLVNDLEAAALSLRPELARLRGDLEQALGRIVRMSGSGSSLFTLFDSRDAAEAAAGIVASSGPVRALAVELAPAFHDDLNAGSSGA